MKPEKQITFWKAAFTDPLEPILMIIGAISFPIMVYLLWANYTKTSWDWLGFVFGVLLTLFFLVANWRSIWVKQYKINNGIVPHDTFFRDNPQY